MALRAHPSAQHSPTPEPTPSIFDQPLPFDSHNLTLNNHVQHLARDISTEDIIMSSPLSSPPSSPASSSSSTSKKRSAPDADLIEASPAKKRSSSKSDSSLLSTSAKKHIPSKTSPPSKAASVATKMPAPNRPRRDRKAPQKYNPNEFKEQPKAARPSRIASKIYDPVYVTTNSHSRLTKADVYHLLCMPSAWSDLSAPQQDRLLSKCPSNTANLALRAKIIDGTSTSGRPQELSLGREIFRTDVAKFKTDLAAGHLAKTWQSEARQAVQDRAEGKFDAWKERESERWWGEKYA